jgi:hypothetical protein
MRKARKPPARPAGGLVLADIPERNRLRELRALLEARRDAIAELDLEIETVREALASFEAAYRARVAPETSALERIVQLVQHLDHWATLLAETPAPAIVSRVERVERRRARQLAGRELPRPDDEEPAQLEAAARSPDERLKAAYRALARRFHPDLARTEEERVRCGALMARINALYHDGDLSRLEAMAEQAKGGELDEDGADLEEQLAILQERLAWFDLVLENLREERADLERTPTCELWRRVEGATARGEDLVAEIAGQLRARVESSYAEVARAARGLESAVDGFNHRNAGGGSLTRRQREALERRFDPHADKRIVRLGLEELRTLVVSPEARELATRFAAELEAKPAVLRLLLFAYVSELSPFPLPGLESWDDLAVRFAALAEEGEAALGLEQSLVHADAWIEFGVRRASEKVVHPGLRFRSALARDAMPVLLESMPVRRSFARVLGVLGERERCPACEHEVFVVPLFRTRGLDDLRALVCPRCGHGLRSYWMPKGKDVQAVLNAAFLDFELVVEWSFRLGRGSFATQLLPLQVEALTVGELKARVFHDVFERYEVAIAEDDLRFAQDGEPVPDEVPLGELESTSFVVRFASKARLQEADALEVLRHRVRNRFRA